LNARLLPSLILQLLAIGAGWDFLIACLGQGAKYVTAGWDASLLGIIMLGMALTVPAAGLLAGLLPSLLLRLPQPMDEGDYALAAMGAGVLHAAAYFALGTLLWRAGPEHVSPNAAYDGSFVLVAAVVALGFGLVASFGAGAIVARRPLRLGW
jgi:hypothetical protein